MQVELTDISLELRRPVMTGRGAITQRDGLLVAITDGGFTGWGEAMPLPGWPDADLSETRRALQAWAADPDPDRLPEERFAHAAVELALLDLEARQNGRTQAEMLSQGGVVADSVEINALVSNADEATRGGGRRLRHDEGQGGCVRCRRPTWVPWLPCEMRSGRAAACRLDANGGWTVEQALAALAPLGQFDIEYIEEPVTGIEALVRVAEQSPDSRGGGRQPRLSRSSGSRADFRRRGQTHGPRRSSNGIRRCLSLDRSRPQSHRHQLPRLRHRPACRPQHGCCPARPPLKSTVPSRPPYSFPTSPTCRPVTKGRCSLPPESPVPNDPA